MASEHVPLLAKYTDVMQVGARNMQNYPLLEAVGESGKTVLLKRGPGATMDEFLLAAEYILKTGNPKVMLCERGIRTFEDHTRFTLPLASVPYLHQTTHLPVVVDPSHGTGKASLVTPMAVAVDRRRRRRPDHRGAPEPGEGDERRLPIADARRVPRADVGMPQGGVGIGAEDVRRRLVWHGAVSCPHRRHLSDCGIRYNTK